MGWNPTEFSQVVTHLRSGDHKAVAMAVSDLFDRQVKVSNQGFSEDIDRNSSDILDRLPRTVRLISDARNLDTAFQISLNNPCLVLYTIELEVQSSLLNSQNISVEVFSDSNPSPLISLGQIKLETSQLLGLSMTLNTKKRQQLVAYVQPGDYLKLVTSGTGIASLINQAEFEFVPLN